MEVTLAAEPQINGDKALGIFKAYGTKTGLSDLAVILGASCSAGDTDILGNLAGWAWTASPFYHEGVCIQGGRNVSACEPFFRSNAIRPVIPPSQAAKILPSRIIYYPVKLPNNQTILMAKYGEYPQEIANKFIVPILERELEQGTLIKTGKKYTFDAGELENPNQPFIPDERLEYQIQNAKYIRIQARPKDTRSTLSNGERVQEGKYYWVKVLPSEWLVDTTGYLIARTGLISGIQFDPDQNYSKHFTQTKMFSYLNDYFSEEILPTNEYLSQQQKFIIFSKHRKTFPSFQWAREG